MVAKNYSLIPHDWIGLESIINDLGSTVLTSSITSLSSLKPLNGNFIVGNGREWRVENGNVLRSSLGLGVSSSPTFAGVILSGLTASQIVGTTADKALVSVPVIGNGLTLSGGNLYWAWLGINDLSESPDEDSMMVWNGAGNAVLWESGATLRTTLGLGTGGAPTFDDLTISSPSNIYALSHDSFADFVSDEHVAHSGVSVIAGTGLTGGGTLESDRTLNVSIGSLDHGGLAGLGDDDHTQYVLANGTRNIVTTSSFSIINNSVEVSANQDGINIISNAQTGGAYYAGDINIKTIASGTQGGGNINIEAQIGNVAQTEGNIFLITRYPSEGGYRSGDIHIYSQAEPTYGSGNLYFQEEGGNVTIGDSSEHEGIKFYVQGDDGVLEIFSPSVCQFLAGTAYSSSNRADPGGDSFFGATHGGTPTGGVTDGGNGGRIIFESGDGGNGYDGETTDGGDGGNLIFRVGSKGYGRVGGSNGVDGFIALNGNVRIGSEVVPTVALDVTGEIKSSTIITADTFTDGVASLVGGSLTGLTNLTVDNINTNGKTITSDTGEIDFDGSNLNIIAASDSTDAILKLRSGNSPGSGTSQSDLKFYDGDTLGFRFLASFGNANPSDRYGGFIAYSDRDNTRLPLRFFTPDVDGTPQSCLFLKAGQAAGLGGNVGIGTTNPLTKLAIFGNDDKDTGPILNLSGIVRHGVESGRIRFTERTIASSGYQGAFIHYNGSTNIFSIGVHNVTDVLTANDTAAISISRSTAYVNIPLRLRIGDTAFGTETLEVPGSAWFGDDTNNFAVSATGVVTLNGSAKRHLTVRPDFDYSKITALGKPTQITLGAHQGFSLPLYAADEELFFSLNVPGRWDEASDITVDVLVALSAAETVNDDFNLQLSWQNTMAGSGTDVSVVIDATLHDVAVETNIPDARKAQYNTYIVHFTLDYDVDDPHILSHDLLSMRLRRIAVAGTEIAGEIIVLDTHVHFQVDKMFQAPE